MEGRDFRAALSPLAGLPGDLRRNRKLRSQNRRGRKRVWLSSPVRPLPASVLSFGRSPAASRRLHHGPQRCRRAEAGERRAGPREVGGCRPGPGGAPRRPRWPDLPVPGTPPRGCAVRGRVGLGGRAAGLGSRRCSALWSSRAAGVDRPGPDFGEGHSGRSLENLSPSGRSSRKTLTNAHSVPCEPS